MAVWTCTMSLYNLACSLYLFLTGAGNLSLSLSRALSQALSSFPVLSRLHTHIHTVAHVRTLYASLELAHMRSPSLSRARARMRSLPFSLTTTLPASLCFSPFLPLVPSLFLISPLFPSLSLTHARHIFPPAHMHTCTRAKKHTHRQMNYDFWPVARVSPHLSLSHAHTHTFSRTHYSTYTRACANTHTSMHTHTR